VIQPGDMDVIQQPIDFLGLNIYFGNPIEANAEGQPQRVPDPVGQPVTLLHWPVRPASLYWGPRYIYERYGLPIYITENGLSNSDWVAQDGQVHDPQRIDFTTQYLKEYRRAGEDGIDIRGYFHWSVMDNLEWASAMKHRFGLIHVDFQTLKRTLKDSAYWYQGVIQSNGAAL
jgi:beta-glucosidase